MNNIKSCHSFFTSAVLHSKGIQMWTGYKTDYIQQKCTSVCLKKYKNDFG